MEVISSVTLLPLYSLGNSSRYPMDRRLDDPQIWSGRCGDVRKPLPTPGIELRLLAI
jgi:hypothetical protein